MRNPLDENQASATAFICLFSCVIIYSFQYIPSLCKIPASTAQNVISANITYNKVPTLCDFHTSKNT